MDTLLSVLLYLNVINPANHYTVNDIHNYGVIYATPIIAIEYNPTQLETVLNEEELIAITVMDGLGG